MTLTAERDRRDNAKQRVLEALVAAGAAGVCNTALNAICYRYGARVHELRAEGHAIAKTHEGDGVYRYTLTPADAPQRFMPPASMPVYHTTTPAPRPRQAQAQGELF